MKKALLFLALASAAACSGGASPSAAPKQSEADLEIQMASSIAFDPSLLKVGEKVVYFVKRSREGQSIPYTWQVVGEQGSALWIENKIPFEPRAMVVKSKIDRTGKLLEQWVGEPGGVPGQTFPNPRKKDEPPPRRDPSTAKADSKEEPDQVTLAGRTYACTKVTTMLTYPDGRKSEMLNWFSKDVAFAATRQLGGLVKRQLGRLTMELAMSDPKGARSELEIPPPPPK